MASIYVMILEAEPKARVSDSVDEHIYPGIPGLIWLRREINSEAQNVRILFLSPTMHQTS